MPISPEDIRDYLASHAGRAADLRELIRHFDVPEMERPAFRRMVKGLARDGSLVRARGGRYAAPEALDLIEGTLEAHPDGYAFLLPDPGSPAEAAGDVFIPRGRRGGAAHGDRVAVRARRGRGGKREGEVVRVIERGVGELPGRIEREGRRRWFVPLDPRYGGAMAVEGDDLGARPGMVAVLRVTRHPGGRRPGAGTLTRVLGFPDDPDVEVGMICAEFGIRTDFPEKVIREADGFGEPEEKDLRDRKDLRGRLTVTIDGETAKDFDDAVSVEALPGGGRLLGVHIADVSHYVREGGALDEEARLRGTSTYFPGRAVPMLPPNLSENVCSLVPGRDRLTLSAFLDYDAQGALKRARFARTVIRSRARLTYAGVTAFLEGTAPPPPPGGKLPPDVTPPDRYAEVPGLEAALRDMADLARRLRERRLAEGGLDFEIPEAEVLVDAGGRVTAIRRAPRGVSDQIIEDFMLAANRAVAESLAGEGNPAMFRVHEPPDADRLQEAALLFRHLGYRIPDLSSGAPAALRAALAKSRGTPEEALVNRALLRSMKLARYDAGNLGHFGLGFVYYTHFTSPIRRYPDLIVHRLLQAYGLAGGARLGRRRLQSLESRMQALAEEASEKERAAESAERAMVNYKSAQFMKEKVGEVFEGKVSGLVETGFFVTLNEHFVDGFVRLSDLEDDFYEFVEERYELVGRRTKRTIRLADPVTVRVDRADLERRRIDFSLVRAEGSGGPGKRRASGKPAARPDGRKDGREGGKPRKSRRPPRKRPRQAGRGSRRERKR